jgi:hypothetical protein
MSAIDERPGPGCMLPIAMALGLWTIIGGVVACHDAKGRVSHTPPRQPVPGVYSEGQGR